MALFLLVPFSSDAQRPGGRPPSLVAIASGHEGVLAPQHDNKGIVFFKETSEVATEVSGKVTSVVFEEGEHVKSGDVLVQLDDSILQKELQAARATYDRYHSELDDSNIRFDRAKTLLEDEVTTPQQFDMLRFEVQSDTHQLSAMKAEVGRLETLVEKHTIRAPFDGIVVDRQTEVGEWKGNGEVVGTVALENIYDVMVEVPEDQLRWVIEGSSVVMRSLDARRFQGTIVTIIPRGNVVTGLFPVKVRVEAPDLYEGMSLTVSLPVGETQECLFVPRDALLNRIDGSHVVFTLVDSKAVPHVVEVLGYDGLDAAIYSSALKGTAHQFIVKGHERLRSGDTVKVVETTLTERERKTASPDS